MRLPISAGLATGAVSLTLYPLFADGAWFWTSLGMLIVTTLVATLITRLALPGWLAPVGMLGGSWLFLTLVYARDDAWLAFIPTKDSVLALAELLVEGFDDIQQYAAPVPANPGISLLTAGGAALIAILVDLFAVRVRRAALAGLPLLALFTVPAAVLNEPIGWPAFVIGALGYVGLLVADGRERVSHWGRAVLVRRSKTTTTADAGRLALSGKRVGVTAIALSIAIPALIPTLTPDPLFGFGVGNGLGDGGNNVGIPDAVAKLSGQLTQPVNATVMSYTSADDTPRYLRIYSLDVFDGRQFKPSSLKGRPEDKVDEGPMPPVPGLSPSTPTTRTSTTIQISDEIEELRFLPLPYPATQVAVDGDWRADRSTLMVFSTRDEAAGLEYEVTGMDLRPTFDTLDQAPVAPVEVQSRFLALPRGLDPRIMDLALEVTDGAPSQYQQAVKLQEWFTKTGQFAYSLTTRGSGNEALAEFLLNSRTGYCEQFASAMAVMARLLGIPARVSIGYTGGSKIDGRWVVRTHDAHAWPELYFEGAGWLRFEPTPAGGGGQATARVPQYSLPVTPTASPTAGASANPTTGATDPAGPDSEAARNIRELEDPFAGTSGAVAEPGMPLIVKILIGVGVALLLSLIPALMRLILWLWRRRIVNRAAGFGSIESSTREEPESDGWTRDEIGSVADPDDRPVVDPAKFTVPAVEAAWAELCDTLTDLGMARQTSETPRALGRRLTERYELDREAAAAIARISSAEERLRYARVPAVASPLVSDLQTARSALAATVSWQRRVGALLTPVSALLRLRAIGEGLLDGFDRLEGNGWRPRRKARTGKVARTEKAEPTAERPLAGTRR
ncbi:DUF3488 and transglutaminase-like domain-containing protein [Acrocarpospora macrocephala]|uniref:Transglutaminase n=1 Tax=Acrocarpospora macrocephala TaxID=150177 RepID=A0A5M3WU31_9ACTN|nr:DUF3488 and transglutaminase-like domain-containing protein [Acrocarpospora macrocephala]GES10771.1 transglutaminase [Acrocarpospora macrocephala]